MENNKIYTGHALEVLRTFPDSVFHACITSPPYYGLRNYKLEPLIWGGNPACQHRFDNEVLPRFHNTGGMTEKQATNIGSFFGHLGSSFCCECGAWRGQLGLEPDPNLYVEHLVELFREVKRVLRDDGTLWLNLGDSYMSHSGDFSKSAGFQGDEIRRNPEAATAKNVYFPKTHLYKAGVLKNKDLIGIPWRAAFALQADGWYLRSDIVWSKPNPMPESVEDRPTKAHEYVFLFSKCETYYYDHEAIKEPSTERASGNLERKVATEGEESRTNTHLGYSVPYEPDGTGRNRRSVWSIATKPFKGAHFATFPPALIEPMVLAGTSEKGCCSQCGTPWVRITDRTPGASKECPKTQAAHEARGGTGTPIGTVGKSGSGRVDGYSETIGWEPGCSCIKDQNTLYTIRPCIVLDLFAGSGTVAETAIRLGRDYVLIELNPQYVKIAEKRIADCWASLPTMRETILPGFEAPKKKAEDKKVYEEMKLL